MYRAIPVLVATLALALVAGCGAPVPVPGAPIDHAHMTHLMQSGPVRMLALSDGGWIPFSNGAEQTVSGVQVQVWLTPFPPARKAVIHYQIAREHLPVEGAVLNLTYDHESMDHGPFTVSAVPHGPGQFEAPLEFIMAGPFWIDTRIHAEGLDGLLKLIIQSDR